MDTLATYPERLNHLPIDLRAEGVLADMLEDGISLEELIIKPVGNFKRAFGRDIHQVVWVEAQHRQQRWLQIDLNRSGLYDLLPEGVFHQPTTSETLTDKDAILREMSVQRQREQAARRFFLPIEQEFFRHRIRIEQEQRGFLADSDAQSDSLLGWFWELPDFLTPVQTKRLFYLLPVMHQLAGDLAAMTACFEQLIEERVQLQLDPPALVPVQDTDFGWESAPLGQWELGTDSVFGGWVADEWPTLRITIFLDRTDRVAAYLPGNDGHRLVEWLAGYVVPLEAAVQVDLDTSALRDAFELTADDAFGRLNFTITL